MNNWYASDPKCFKSVTELKFFLEQFGTLTSRYHLSMPSDWSRSIREGFSEASVMERHRITEILIQAKERAALFERRDFIWNKSLSWVENAHQFNEAKNDLLSRIFVSDPADLKASDSAALMADLYLPPTEEEYIYANALEYARVSNILTKISQELYFVDPYLDPLNVRVARVLTEVLKNAAAGKCKKVLIFARNSEVAKKFSSKKKIEAIEMALEDIRQHARLRAPIRMFLLDDKESKDRLHGRYLFSMKGGVRLDQGFQELRQGKGFKKVEVSPVGKSVLHELHRKFVRGDNDLEKVLVMSTTL